MNNGDLDAVVMWFNGIAVGSGLSYFLQWLLDWGNVDLMAITAVALVTAVGLDLYQGRYPE